MMEQILRKEEVLPITPKLEPVNHIMAIDIVPPLALNNDTHVASIRVVEGFVLNR